jgi:hypothetical protein
MTTTQISELQTLLSNIQFEHHRLNEKKVKKASVDLRKHLQRTIVICKQMRVEALAAKKALPTKKRVKKDAEQEEEPQLPVPEEVSA